MVLILGKIKCWFCGGKDGVIHSVCEYGIYGDAGKRIFYHQECLEMVEVYPEIFGHKTMDKAIHIDDLRKKNMEKCNSKLVKEFNKKIDTLHRNHFERMMPKHESNM